MSKMLTRRFALNWIGSSDSGLTGPFAFPTTYRWQRIVERRLAARKAARRIYAVPRIALYVEAAPLPVKRLRHLITELAISVREHYAYDIGEEMFNLFPVILDHVCIDFASASLPHECARDGTRMWFDRLRDWFVDAYANLQRRAIANGRYFPPPLKLHARIDRSGMVFVNMCFARGYLRVGQTISVSVEGLGYVVTRAFVQEGGNTDANTQ